MTSCRNGRAEKVSKRGIHKHCRMTPSSIVYTTGAGNIFRVLKLKSMQHAYRAKESNSELTCGLSKNALGLVLECFNTHDKHL